MYHTAEDGSSMPISTRATTMMAEPVIGIHLYLPVRETSCPETIDETSSAPIMGIISMPASVAEAPVAIWR